MSRLVRSLLLVGVLGVAGVAAVVAWPIGVDAPDTLTELEADVDRGAYLAPASKLLWQAMHPDARAR